MFIGVEFFYITVTETVTDFLKSHKGVPLLIFLFFCGRKDGMDDDGDNSYLGANEMPVT